MDISTFEYFNSSFTLNASVTEDPLYVNGFAGGAFADFTVREDALEDFRASGALSLSNTNLFTNEALILTGFASLADSTFTSDHDTQIRWNCDADLSCFGTSFDNVEIFNSLLIKGSIGAAYATLDGVENIGIGSFEGDFRALGMLSFYRGAIVNSTGESFLRRRRELMSIDQRMWVAFSGFAAGYQATVNCPADTQCQIRCNSRLACYNLVLNCDELSECQVFCNVNATAPDGNFCPLGTFEVVEFDESDTLQVVENATIEDYGDVDTGYADQFINYLLSLYDPMTSSALALQLQPMMYYQECAIFINESTASGSSSGIMINGSSFADYLSDETKGEDGSFICFSGGFYYDSTITDLAVGREAVLNLTSTDLDGYTTLCDGEDACEELEFTSNLANALLCRGSDACRFATVTGASVLLCSGDSSCEQECTNCDRRLRRSRSLLANTYWVTDVETIFCTAYDSCRYATVGLTGETGLTEMTVYALGNGALQSAKLYNVGNDTVFTVVVDAESTLQDATLYCTGNNVVCKVFCFGSSDCPSDLAFVGCTDENVTCTTYRNEYQLLAEMLPTVAPTLSPTKVPTGLPFSSSHPETTGTEGTETFSSTTEEEDRAHIGHTCRAGFVILTLGSWLVFV